MKKTLLRMLPYLGANALTFYLSPVLFSWFTTSGSTLEEGLQLLGALLVLIIFVMPAISLVIGVVYGLLNSFKWYYSLFVIVLLTPYLFFGFDAQMILVGAFYLGASFLGNFIGWIFRKIFNKTVPQQQEPEYCE